MKSNKSIVLYCFCLIFGGIISYLFLRLPPTESERAAIDVEVKMPENVLIRETIEKPVVKYKYLYRDRKCSCGKCADDTIKYR